MIVIAKAADVLIQPRVLKVASTIKSLGLRYKIIGVASENVKINNINKLAILNISVKKTILLKRSRHLRRIIKLIKYFIALYTSRANYYYVHDPLSIVLVYIIKITRNDIDIIYMGDELEVGRKFTYYKQLYINVVMKSTPYFCSSIFQADFYRTKVFEKHLNYNKIKMLRNVPNKIRSFSPIEIRRKYNISEDTKIFIYTGLISENRGIMTIINGLSILSDKVGVCFIIIGWGPKGDLIKIKEYSTLKEAEHNSFKVLFIKQMPLLELFNWIHECDVGIGIISNYNQSYYLCTPSKVYEYMMAGIPFLASNFPENKLLVQKTNAGILVNPNSPEDICFKAYNLLSNVERKKQMGMFGRLAALEKYNWEKESKILKETIH